MAMITKEPLSYLESHASRAVPLLVWVLGEQVAPSYQKLLMEFSHILQTQLQGLFPGKPPGLVKNSL